MNQIGSVNRQQAMTRTNDDPFTDAFVCQQASAYSLFDNKLELINQLFY